MSYRHPEIWKQVVKLEVRGLGVEAWAEKRLVVELPGQRPVEVLPGRRPVKLLPGQRLVELLLEQRPVV